MQTSLKTAKGPQTWSDALNYVQWRDECTPAQAYAEALKLWPELHPAAGHVNQGRARR